MPRLFIATPTHSLQGGVERILESLARLLPPRGFDVVFGLVRGGRFNAPDKFRAAFPSIRGVEVDGTSGTAYGRRRALRRAIVESDPDIVLIARMFDVYPVACELKRAGHRLRLALTIQAFEPEYFIDLKRYAGSVDVCIGSGGFISDEIVRLTSFPRERVYDIPGGVAAPRRFVRRETIAPLRIGYVGRLEQEQKRALDLIAFAEELRRRGIAFTLDVAGDGEAAGELRKKLPDARFHGWVSTQELYEEIYPEIDVLVHFAAWEGITIAPREAMAHGVVPVISAFAGHEQQFVHDVNALVFPIADIAAAADAIVRLDRDRDRLDRLGEAARQSQTGIRSEEGAADAWAAACRDALAKPARIAECPPVSIDTGLMTRLHVPQGLAEVVRRARRLEHTSAGAEWPHWSGIDDADIRALWRDPAGRGAGAAGSPAPD